MPFVEKSAFYGFQLLSYDNDLNRIHLFCKMIQIDEILISEELFKEYFVCDLNSCKGACCVEGDAGAPLDIEEIDQLESELDQIKPFLTEKGLKNH